MPPPTRWRRTNSRRRAATRSRRRRTLWSTSASCSNSSMAPAALYRDGLKVYTTISPTLQTTAEQVAREQIAKLKDKHVTNAALVALDAHTGEILAMLGSVDFYDKEIDGQVNIALRPRQPGSSIKPLTYVTRLPKRLDACDVDLGCADDVHQRRTARTIRPTTMTASFTARSPSGRRWRTRTTFRRSRRWILSGCPRSSTTPRRSASPR